MLNIDGKLQTRCGLPVTLLVRDLKGPFPLGGIIHNVVDFKKEEKEIVRGWKLNGRYLECEEDHPYDLMNISCKREKYMVMQKFTEKYMFHFKETAESTLYRMRDSENFRIAKVEWFE